MHEGAAVHEILHAWGTNGVLTRIWFALTPAVEWVQCTVAFDTYDQAFTFTESIADGSQVDQAPGTVFEWPIPSFFTPIKHTRARRQSAGASHDCQAAQADALAMRRPMPQAARLHLPEPYEGPRTQPLLSDYTWNHTTLWAMKADAAYTYLQCGFSPTECREQFRQLRERYRQ